jgi:hypothetical protein
MNTKKFLQIIENLPSSIHATGEEHDGTLRFTQDFELEFGDKFGVQFTASGYQPMKYSEAEEEVGISDGWEMNEDAEIEIEYIINLKVYIDDEQQTLFTGQHAKLRHELTELLTTQTL